MSHAVYVQDESLCQARPSSSSPSSRCSATPLIVFYPGLGKRQGRESTVTPGTIVIYSLSSATSQAHEGALSVFCSRQRRSFLVDSGADVSVYPATPAQKKCRSKLCLSAANGSSIKTFGRRAISLAFPGLSVVHKFLLADVKKPILGTDFFPANNLLIDISCQRLSRPSSQENPVPVEVRARRPFRWWSLRP